MVWVGLALVVAGMAAAFGFGGEVGGVSLALVGGVAMAAGAVLAVAGFLRLRRSRLAGARVVRDHYRTSRGKTFAMIAAVLYIVSPIDVIPDVLLPVGIVDDTTALAWLVLALWQEHSRRSRAREVARREG
ncbi:hypothetical protein GCM10009678_52840 [Actinomadura kijaniata]|uniref:Uncharacterized membrane protein YkvA (DUF1232 family) n=1 Tax=Actinomadura namibiensis TaxID=182080 RepID=A0A7W3LQN6_ACTNM|nr:YkvA family protein [Actinomadura namibiensis]MBA8952425.1 uncharacterized membrane protein YkvA (DUF1232 family) [Actinomadura namibiensis]